MNNIITKISKLTSNTTFIRFFISGVIAFCIDNSIVVILRKTVFQPDGFTVVFYIFSEMQKISIEKSIAATIAALTSFMLQRYWTYKNAAEDSMKRQLVKFSAVFGLNVIVASLIFPRFEQGILQLFSYIETTNLGDFYIVNLITKSEGMTLTIANVCTTFVIMFISFILYTKVVFKTNSKT